MQIVFGGTIGSLLSAMMGGKPQVHVSFFSVGLSLWMSAMILWQMFSSLRRWAWKIFPLDQDRRRMYLAPWGLPLFNFWQYP